MYVIENGYINLIKKKVMKAQQKNTDTPPMRVNIDFTNYQRSVAEEIGRFKPIAEGLEKLKKLTHEIPLDLWEILYNALDTGDLRSAMAKYWANKNLMDWDDVDVRNKMRAKFSYLPKDSTFPKEYVERKSSGEFDVSISKIYKSNQTYYERTIEPEQVDLVNQLCDIISELKLQTHNLNRFIYYNSTSGKPTPRWAEIASVIGHK